MRGKRAKQYRKLMHAYAVTFSFREPFQCLVDSQIIQDAARFKMDLVGGLERTLQGKVKPMITQCDMRHLYATKDQTLIQEAQKFERRRCNHHELENPLSSLECLSEVVDPKSSSTNKHRYVVASQDPDLRAHMRTIPGVPLIYINRSIMILEPMAARTEQSREQDERRKFKAGIKSQRGPQKRKREENEENDTLETQAQSINEQATDANSRPQKKKKMKGLKGPNPLSVKKSKKRLMPEQETSAKVTKSAALDTFESVNNNTNSPDMEAEEGSKPGKRRRRHKPKGNSANDALAAVEAGVS